MTDDPGLASEEEQESGGGGEGKRDPILDFLLWIRGFRRIFSDPCVVCGSLLQVHPDPGVGPLPPTVREYVTGLPLHALCQAREKEHFHRRHHRRHRRPHDRRGKSSVSGAGGMETTEGQERKEGYWVSSREMK